MREYIQNAFRKMDKDAFFKASVRKGAEEYLAQKARESVMTEEERRQEAEREMKRCRRGKCMVAVYLILVFAAGLSLVVLGARGII